MAAMNPSPTKPIVRYPTALLEDKELVTLHDTRLPDYKAFEYGTPFPDQAKYPGLKLVFQEPLGEDDRMVRRVWAGERADQDLYNSDRKYSGGSMEHPIIIRRYLFPEDGYAPLPSGTNDSQFSDAVLVDEEVTRPENRNGFLAVTRVFETIPGPTLSGKQAEQGLLGVKSTVESIVPAGTPEDPLSLSVISSAVEPIDSVRSRKVTVESSGPTSLSGGQKKEGLLGETSVDEYIVAAGTQPDALSQTVVSSVIEPVDSAKSRKITITSTGPDSLTESSNDGKLLGDTTTTESIVAPNTVPDAPSSTILSSQVKQLDSGKSVKTSIVLNSTPTLLGGQAGEGLLGTIDRTETIVPSGTIPDEVSLTVISSQVEPIDSVRSRKVTVESSGPTILSGKAMTTQFGGGVVSSVEEIVATNSNISPNFRTVSSNVTPIDSSKSRKETVELPDGEDWPMLETIKDGPFNERIILTSKVVPIATALPSNLPGIIWESEAADKWRSIHTSRNVTSLLGKEFVEYETNSFTFPALIKIRGASLSDRSQILFSRPSQSGIFVNKVITEYTEELPEILEDPLIISTVSFSGDAGSFSGVLHNCRFYQFDGELIRAPQSEPSSLNYHLGEEALIRSTTVKDQIGLYKTVKTYIELL